jgi:hypothetical protein
VRAATQERDVREIPVDERLTPEASEACSLEVPNFIRMVAVGDPNAQPTPLDHESAFRSLAEEGDLSIEDRPGGYKVTPVSGMGLYHVAVLLGGL